MSCGSCSAPSQVIDTLSASLLGAQGQQGGIDAVADTLDIEGFILRSHTTSLQLNCVRRFPEPASTRASGALAE